MENHKYTNIWKIIAIWHNAGNYVMIETKEKYIVFLAHLKENSVRVNKGQLMKLGKQIGNVRNSRSSTAPHLHINIFDQMENPLKAKVFFCF